MRAAPEAQPPERLGTRPLTVGTGLRLSLDGATADADLRVRQVGPVALPAGRAFEARTAGGDVWRRLWLAADRMVVEFVGFCHVEVRADGSITFDRPLPAELEQHLVLDHLLALELARRGHLVLHGAVLTLEDRALVLAGPSGAGKSTLTAHAWRAGWTVGGDDGAVLSPDHPWAAEPTYPTIRLSPDAADLLGVATDTSQAVVGKRRLVSDRGPAAFSGRRVPLALVAVLDPVPGGQPAQLTRLRGVDAHVALFSSTFHADLGGGPLMRGVVDRLGSVADSVTVARVRVPRGLDGLAAAEQVLRSELLR